MTTTPTTVQARQRLRAEGLRVTPQRLLVLRILEEAERRLNADDIYARAREHHPHLSLSTVYRTLSKLKRMGLVAQRYLTRAHKRAYYEATSKGEHYHFACLGCGRIIELKSPRLVRVSDELAEQVGLVFTHVCACFEGYCAECAAKIEQNTIDLEGHEETARAE